MALQFKVFGGRAPKAQKKGERQRIFWQSAVNDAEYWMNNEAVEVIDVKCHVTQGKSRVAVVVLYRAAEFSPRPDGRGRYSLHLVVSSSGQTNETWQRTLNITAGELAQIAHKQFLSQGVALSGELISCSFSQVSHRKKDAASSVRLICTGEPRRRRGQGEIKFRIVEAVGNQWGWVLNDAMTVVQKIVDEGGTIVDVDMAAVEQRSYTSPTSLMMIAYTEAPIKPARPSTAVTLEFVANSVGSRPQPLSKHYKPQPTLWEKELPFLAQAAEPLAQVDRLICTAFAPWQCEQGGPAWMLVVSYDTAPPVEQFAIVEQGTQDLRSKSPGERRRFVSPRPVVHKMKRGEALVGRPLTPGDLARSWSPNPRAPSPTGRSARDGATRQSQTASPRRPGSPFNRTTPAQRAPSFSQRRVENVASLSEPQSLDSLTQVVESRLKTYSKAMVQDHSEPEPEPEFTYAAASPGALSGVELAVAYREHVSRTGNDAMDIQRLDDVAGLARGSGTSAANSRVGKTRGFKAAHIAAYDGDVAALLKCVQNGAAIDKGDRQKNTPLHVACERGHVNVVDALLVTGCADPDSRNARLQTPLHVAAAHGHLHVIKRLLDNGRAAELGQSVADDKARDIEGRDAAELAEQNHFHHVVAYLRGLDTSPSQRSHDFRLQADDDDELASVRSDADALAARLSHLYADLPPGSVDSKFSPPPPSPVPRISKRTMSEGLAAAHDVLLAYRGHDAAEQPRAAAAASATYIEPAENSILAKQKADETSTESIMRLAKDLDERELGVVIAALSKQREELKAAVKRVKSGTKKRRDADLYRESLEKLSAEELRRCTKDYDVDRQVSHIMTSSSKSAEVKSALVDLLMSRYMEIVHRGEEPPRPITSSAGTAKKANARSPSGGSTYLREPQGARGMVVGQGQPNAALQFSEMSLAPSAGGEGATADPHRQTSAGQHLDDVLSENFKFDSLISGGSWYLCELQPTTPDDVAARLPQNFGRTLFWNKETRLYYDSRTPPTELADEVGAKVLGHESLEMCEQVLRMLGPTGFPEVHARTHRLLERYVGKLRDDASGSPLDDGISVTSFRNGLWAQSSRGRDSSASNLTHYPVAVPGIAPEPEPEVMIGRSSSPIGRNSHNLSPQPRARSPSKPSPVSSLTLDFSHRISLASGLEPVRGEAMGSQDTDAGPLAEGLPPQRGVPQQRSQQQPATANSRYGGTRLEKQMEIMRAERQAAKERKRAAKRLAKHAANSAN